MKKLLSILLVVTMLLSMMSFSVVAEAEVTMPTPVNGVITLTGNVELAEPYVVAAEDTVTIDLNGYTIIGTMHKSVGAVLKNEGTLLLKNGTVKSTANNGGSAVANSGTITIEDVTLNGAPNADGSWPSYTINNTGVMTINNSDITSYHGALASYGEGAVATLNDTNIDMEGIPGFTSHGIYTYNSGAVVVNGGNIANKATDQGSTGGSVINGAVTVNAGTFSGRIESYYGTPVIYGGTFDKSEANQVKKFLAEGSEYDAETGIARKLVAAIGTKRYASLAEAMKAAQAGDTVTILEGTYEVPKMKAGITVVGEGDVLLEGTLSGALDNLTLKNLHIKGANAQRWAYANGNLVFENVTFEATSVYALHFDGIAEGTNLLYKNCTIIGWAAMGGSPASCVFDGCTIKDNGSYGVIRTYFDAEIKDCTFDVDGANMNDQYQDGIHAVGATVEVNNCTNQNGEIKDILNVTTDGLTRAEIYVNENLATASPVAFQVSTKSELDAALAAAREGDTILFTTDIDYGSDQLKIDKAITLDLGSKTLTTSNNWGGMSVKNNPTIKNGNIVHTGNTAAIKVWNAIAFEDLTIDVNTYTEGKVKGGIVLQSGSTTCVGSLKNVTIKGAGLTNGIETYNCGDAAQDVIGSMENVTIDAIGTGMLISAPCGAATNCNIKGGITGIEIWIKGTYSATLDLVDSKVAGGKQAVYAHDEFSSNPSIVNNGSLDLTVDEDTALTSENGADPILLTLARAEDVQGVLKEVKDDSTVKINNTYYLTLQAALNAAASGEVITLTDDITEEVAIDGKKVTIDLNKNILNGAIKPSTGDITLKNGSIVNKNSSSSAIEVNSGKLTIEDVNVSSARHGVRIDGAVEAVIDGGEYMLTATSGTRHAVNVSGTANVIIKDGTFVGPKGTSMDSGSAVCVQEGATVTIEDGNFSGGKNATLGVSGKLTVYGGQFDQDPSAYVATGYRASQNAAGYIVVDNDEITDSIYVLYEDVTPADATEEKVYGIVVKANDGDVINQLETVDLLFNLTGKALDDGEVTFTVRPADGFTMSQTGKEGEENRYMFNYSTLNGKWEGTAEAITVGYITVGGYGEYAISTNAEATTNLVNATTYEDNLVDYYTAAGATDNNTATGALFVNKDDNTTDKYVASVNSTIEVPTYALTISIDFNNLVEKNAAAYQDMKVEIVGGVIDKELALGNTDYTETNVDYPVTVKQTAKGYVLTANLPYNTSYAVTVSGAGYRTAYCDNIKLTEAKTVQFWNNVMSDKNALEVLVGSGKKVTKNFLAGEVVKDGEINIYDLSAVVSYFGQNTDKTAYSKYAKYDLNRDGVIDSKDVAYVLVSWNE